MEKFVFGISILYIVILLLVLLSLCFKQNYIKSNSLKCMLWIAAIATAYIAYCIVPSFEMDLYRYFKIVDYFRENNIRDILVNYNSNNQNTNSLFDLIIMLVATSSNNHWLSAICNLFFYGVFIYILFDYNNSRFIEVRQATFFVINFLSLTFISMNLSNLRYPIAAAIMSIALYRDIYKELGLKKTIIWYVCAVAVHIGLIPFLVLRVLFQFRIARTKSFAIVLISWSFFSISISEVMKNMPITLIKNIGYKLSYYYEYLSKMWDVNLIRYLCVFSILVFVSIIIKIGKKRNIPNRYEKMFFLIMMFVIGSIGSYQLFARYYYVIAIFGMPYIWEKVSIKKNNKYIIQPIGGFMIFLGVLILFLQIRIIKNYDFINMSWIWE